MGAGPLRTCDHRRVARPPQATARRGPPFTHANFPQHTEMQGPQGSGGQASVHGVQRRKATSSGLCAGLGDGGAIMGAAAACTWPAPVLFLKPQLWFPGILGPWTRDPHSVGLNCPPSSFLNLHGLLPTPLQKGECAPRKGDGESATPPAGTAAPPRMSEPISCTCFPPSYCPGISPRGPKPEKNTGLLSPEFTSNKPLP